MGFHLREDYRYQTKKGKKKKILKGYLADCYDASRRPQRKRFSLGTKDKRVARQRLTKLERDYAMGLCDPWTDTIRQDGILVDEAIQEFLENRRQKGCKVKTVTNYTDILRIFAESLPPAMAIRLVEPRHFTAFLDGQDLNATSRATYYRHLRAFVRWCVKEGILKDSPLPHEAKRKSKKQVVRFLTREEYGLLLRTIEADAVLKASQLREGEIIWLIDLIKFAVGTGLRRGELRSLRWSAIDLRSGYVTVKNTKEFETKSGHERSVYLTGDAREVIERLSAQRKNEADDYVFKGVKGGQINAGTASGKFRKYRRMAGLPESLKFHSLRHTFASWAVMGGMDLFKLKEILGHASIEQTMIYAHLRPEAQKEDMERIFGRVGESGEYAEQEVLRQEVRKLRAEIMRLRKIELQAAA